MARSSVAIQLSGLNAIKKNLRALEEMKAPEITTALGRISELAEREVKSSAPSSMAGRVSTRPGKQLGPTLTFGVVKHPGAKAMEFGRTTYYEGYQGRNQKSGRKVKRPGQKPKPFVGIKTGKQAMGRLEGPIRDELGSAVLAVWNRPGSD